MLRILAKSVVITPCAPLPLFGRAGRPRIATAVKTPLEANILLIRGHHDDVILIGLDTLYPSEALSKDILRLLSDGGINVPPASLLLVSTHTHNAPALDSSKATLGRIDTSYLAMVASRIAQALTLLFQQSPTPALLQTGQALCDASVHRRLSVRGFNLATLSLESRVVMAPDAGVPIDQRLRLYLWTTTSGEPVAILWHWPCHAVTEHDATKVSSDFPGLIRTHIRRRFSSANLPVIYLPGFSADIRPYSISANPIITQRLWLGVGRKFARNSVHAQNAFRRKLTGAIDDSIDSAAPTHSCNSLFYKSSDLPTHEIFQGHTAKNPLSCSYFALGPLKITALTAEVSHGHQPPEFADTLFTGCAQQVFGYLPTDAQVRAGGYEATFLSRVLGLQVTFRPSLDSIIKQHISPPAGYS